MKYLLLIGLMFICLNISASPYDRLADQTYRKLDNSLTLQIIPSTYPLNWTTPRALIFSILKNQYYFPVTKSDIGHVTVELNCTINSLKHRFFIGQTTKGKGFFRDKLKEGHGLSILNRPGQYRDIPLVTVPGKLNDKDQTYNEYNRLIKINHFGAISFEIDGLNCLKAMEFAKEYTRKTKDTSFAGNAYGFGADPLKFEGSGCAPMAEALLIKANLLAYQKNFLREVYVPRKLIGNPSKGDKVGVITLLISSHDMSIKGEKTLPFKFPDPQLMYDFIEMKHESDKVRKYSFPNSESKLLEIRL